MTGDYRRRDRFERTLEPVSVEHALGEVLTAHDVHVDIRREELFADWKAYIGEAIATRTRPREIARDVLVIEVASSTWLHELRLMKSRLLADLRAKLGDPPLFSDLRLVISGERRDRAAPAHPRPTNRRQRRAPKPLPPPASGEAALKILADAERVEDPELRALIAAVRIAHDK